MDDNYELAGVLCVIIAGLLYGVADWWCNGGRPPSPDAVIDYYRAIEHEQIAARPRGGTAA